MMMNLVGFLMVFGCLFLGQIVVHLTGVPLPPSIIGLLILFGLLCIKSKWLSYVEGVAKTMLTYLAFMIVPACISIMQYLDLLKQDVLPLLAGSAISTLLVLFMTAKSHQLTRRLLKEDDDNSPNPPSAKEF